MYQNVPISDRVKYVRNLYRTTRPKIDISRYRLITEFYQENPQLVGILKRSKNLRNLFEKMPTPVRDHEIIVGYPGVEYRCSPLFPENSFAWFLNEIDTLGTRSVDQYDLDEEDKEYQKYLKSSKNVITNHLATKHSDVAIKRMNKIKTGENFSFSCYRHHL